MTRMTAVQAPVPRKRAQSTKKVRDYDWEGRHPRTSRLPRTREQQLAEQAEIELDLGAELLGRIEALFARFDHQEVR